MQAIKHISKYNTDLENKLKSQLYYPTTVTIPDQLNSTYSLYPKRCHGSVGKIKKIWFILASSLLFV